MYIRKILIGILIVGIAICLFIVYNITQTIFKPITAFNNEEAYVYLPSNANFEYVKQEIAPLLIDVESFATLAKKKGYIKRVKGGKYVIQKGMNSNDIVNTLLNKSIMVHVTIPDANTKEEMAKLISNQIEATEEDLLAILNDTVYLKKLTKEKKVTLPLYVQGVYKMPWNTSAKAFRDQMIENNQKQNQQ